MSYGTSPPLAFQKKLACIHPSTQNQGSKGSQGSLRFKRLERSPEVVQSPLHPIGFDIDLHLALHESNEGAPHRYKCERDGHISTSKMTQGGQEAEAKGDCCHLKPPGPVSPKANPLLGIDSKRLELARSFQVNLRGLRSVGGLLPKRACYNKGEKSSRNPRPEPLLVSQNLWQNENWEHVHKAHDRQGC